MGTTLTGTTPQDTYDSLIKVTDNGPLSGSLKKLTDGLGNDSALSLSTGAASIAGTLAVSSSVTAATALLTSPNVFLQNNAATNSEKQIIIANTGGSARIGVESSTGGAIQIATEPFAAIFGNQSNNPTQFTTNGTTRMTITGAGNVGIGTSAPAQRLDISNGAINFERITTGALTCTDSQGLIYSIINNIGSIDGLRYASRTHRFVSHADASYATIDSDGLKFGSDTAAANALDDYEEGTWTPTYAASGGGSAIHTIQTGTYTKIGNVVTCSFRVQANKSTLSGDISLTGLPFTSSVLNGIALYASRRFATDFVAFAQVSGTSLFLYKNDSSSVSNTPVTDTDLLAATSHNDLYGTFSYLV